MKFFITIFCFAFTLGLCYVRVHSEPVHCKLDNINQRHIVLLSKLIFLLSMTTFWIEQRSPDINVLLNTDIPLRHLLHLNCFVE